MGFAEGRTFRNKWGQAESNLKINDKCEDDSRQLREAVQIVNYWAGQVSAKVLYNEFLYMANSSSMATTLSSRIVRFGSSQKDSKAAIPRAALNESAFDKGVSQRPTLGMCTLTKPVQTHLESEAVFSTDENTGNKRRSIRSDQH